MVFKNQEHITEVTKRHCAFGQNPKDYGNEMSKNANRKTNYKIFPYVNVTIASDTIALNSPLQVIFP